MITKERLNKLVRKSKHCFVVVNGEGYKLSVAKGDVVRATTFASNDESAINLNPAVNLHFTKTARTYHPRITRFNLTLSDFPYNITQKEIDTLLLTIREEVRKEVSALENSDIPLERVFISKSDYAVRSLEDPGKVELRVFIWSNEKA